MLIVVNPPVFDDRLRLCQCCEPIEVQALLAKPPVETFNIGVLGRLARIDKIQFNIMALSPTIQRLTLRDWVHRFNAHGPSGLVNRRGGGPKSLLSASQKHELAQIVAAGPDPELDGVVRWRRIDLVHVIKERFGVSIKERTISNLLRELGFSRMSVRPQHPKQNKRVIKELKKTSQPRLKRTQVIF